MSVIYYKGWEFSLSEDSPIFGKLMITAIKDDLEETFYVYGEEMTKELCEELYREYLYYYGE